MAEAGADGIGGQSRGYGSPVTAESGGNAATAACAQSVIIEIDPRTPETGSGATGIGALLGGSGRNAGSIVGEGGRRRPRDLRTETCRP